MSDRDRGEDLPQRVLAAFCSAQSISEADAAAVVERISTEGADIWESAVHWAESGAFTDSPVIEGYSPRMLSERLAPTMVFTALLELRRRPTQARNALRRHGRGIEHQDGTSEGAR